MLRLITLFALSGFLILNADAAMAHGFSLTGNIQGWCVRGEAGGTLSGAYRYQGQESLGGQLYNKFATEVSMFDDSVYLREDETTGMVWKYEAGQEYLLYDFSLEVGDSVEIVYPSIGTVTYVVLATSTVSYPLLGSLKELELTTTDVLPELLPIQYQNPIWTEGVGSKWGPNYTSLVDTSGTVFYFLDCVNLWTGEQEVVGDGMSDCNSIACTQAISSGLEISAPALSFESYWAGSDLILVFENSAQAATIELLTLDGRSVETRVEQLSFGLRCNVATAPQGGFLIASLLMENGRRGSKLLYYPKQ